MWILPFILLLTSLMQRACHTLVCKYPICAVESIHSPRSNVLTQTWSPHFDTRFVANILLRFRARQCQSLSSRSSRSRYASWYYVHVRIDLLNMWMRSCPVCKALLRKLRLCDSVRCNCGWIFVDHRSLRGDSRVKESVCLGSVTQKKFSSVPSRFR